MENAGFIVTMAGLLVTDVHTLLTMHRYEPASALLTSVITRLYLSAPDILPTFDKGVPLNSHLYVIDRSLGATSKTRISPSHFVCVSGCLVMVTGTFTVSLTALLLAILLLPITMQE